MTSLGLLIVIVGMLTAESAVAWQQDQTQSQSAQQQADSQEAAAPTFDETVVVTASKREEALVDAPATMTVITSETIENSPAQNYGDLLRTVPGLNVAQLSARDINLTSRGSTSTLATSQLVLLDGRSIYQDFFGFVAWDFLPIDTSEIAQIEVIRGPASAVWGANAMTGVVNVITKTPREMQGTSVKFGAGGFDRGMDGNELRAGALFFASVTHAEAVNDRVAYKVSTGVHTQDALTRPTGIIPGTRMAYPSFTNQGSTQPKVDGRLDYDFADGRQKFIVAGGLAGSEGIIHTGIGPFDIQRGSVLGYGKLNYDRDNLSVRFFVNALAGDAPALLAIGTNGRPVNFMFQNQTYDVEISNSQLIGTKHVLSYGGNYRHNTFDLSLAPRGDSRDEGGFYLQDEIFLSDKFRWLVGGRVDAFDVINSAVFSPRTTFTYKPTPDQALTFSFNRAFRAPSFVNSFLDTTIMNQINLGLINPALAGQLFNFPVVAVGNEVLEEESLTAYEVGYRGTFERYSVSAAVYLNETSDSIFFTQAGISSSQQPPPRWPLPPFILDVLVATGNGLPSSFTYLNFEKVRDKGIELSLDTRVNDEVSLLANYSWQAEPEPEGFDISELNLPPTHRFNVGLGYSGLRYFGNASVSFTDEAFWQDVLDARYHGPTESYTLVNAALGVKLNAELVTASLKVSNLFNDAAQQHVFGDFIKRQVLGELRFGF